MRISGTHIILVAIVTLFSCSANKATFSKEKNKKAEVTLSEDDEIKLKSAFFEGNREKMLGNAEESMSKFKECLKIYPQHAPSLYEIGLLQQQMAQSQQAVISLEQTVAIDPANKWYQEALARVYEDNKEFAKAAAVYGDLIDMNPNVMMYYEAKANSLLLANDVKGAMKVYDATEKQFGVNESSSMQKQKIYMALGKTDKAIEEAQKLLDAAPGTPRYYNNLAEIYYKSGQTEKAMTTYQKLLDIDPENAFVQLSMATYYYEGGQVSQAEKVMRKAFANPKLDFDSKARILFNNVAYQNVPPGQVNPFALELVDIMKEAHSDNAQLYAIEGDLQYQSGNLETAKNSYKKSLTLDENQFLVWSQMLLIQSELDDWESTFKESGEAIELFPTQGALYYFRGVAALQLKKPLDAIEAFEGGKDFVTDNNSLRGQFYSNLGDAYYQLKKFKESDKNFEIALKINPNDMLVLNNYSYYLSVRGEKLERAKEMSKMTVDQNPESSTYLDTYAWILYKLGDFEEAKKWMQYALNNGGDKEGVIIEHYGDILFQLNDKAGALNYWNQALEIGGGSEFLQKKVDTKKLYE